MTVVTDAHLPPSRYSNSLMVTLNARKSIAAPPTSVQSGGDTFGMRVHVSRETSRMAPYERDIDQWAGVKLSQLGTTNLAVTQVPVKPSLSSHVLTAEIFLFV